MATYEGPSSQAQSSAIFSLRSNCSNQSVLGPILRTQTRHPAKFPLVVGYQYCIQAERVRGNLQIEWANRLAALFQVSSQVAVGQCGRQVERSNFEWNQEGLQCRPI